MVLEPPGTFPAIPVTSGRQFTRLDASPIRLHCHPRIPSLAVVVHLAQGYQLLGVEEALWAWHLWGLLSLHPTLE